MKLHAPRPRPIDTLSPWWVRAQRPQPAVLWDRARFELERQTELGWAALVERLDPADARPFFERAEALAGHIAMADPEDAGAFHALFDMHVLHGRGGEARRVAEVLFDLFRDQPDEVEQLALRVCFDARDRDLAVLLARHVADALPERRALLDDVTEAFSTAPYLSDEARLALRAFLLERGVVRLGRGFENHCDGELTHTSEWLLRSGYDVERATAHLESIHAGRCDCEVLLHAEPDGLVDSLTNFRPFAARRAFLREQWRAWALTREAEALAAEDPAAALGIAEEAATRNPADPRAHLVRAVALLAAGNADAAYDAVLDALDIDPGQADARLLQGRLLADQGRFAEARQVFSELAEARPDWGEATVGLFGCIIELQEADAFVQVLTKAGDPDARPEPVERFMRAINQAVSARLVDPGQSAVPGGWSLACGVLGWSANRHPLSRALP